MFYWHFRLFASCGRLSKRHTLSPYFRLCMRARFQTSSFFKSFLIIACASTFFSISTVWFIYLFIYLFIEFPMSCSITLYSVDEIMLPMYINWFINFRGFSFNEELVPFWVKLRKNCFIKFHMDTNDAWCLLQDLYTYIKRSERYIDRYDIEVHCSMRDSFHPFIVNTIYSLIQ